MVKVDSLYHDYEGKGSYAVEDVGFEIPAGRIFGFLGPSGAGKSTVQNLMTALLPIQRGEISYDGTSVRDVTPEFFNRIGYSFELPNMYSKLTGLENLRFFASLFSVPTDDPLRLLDTVGLGDATHKRAGRYSKGMKQRLVFARSIINRPSILFLDEPMAGLDPSTAARIKDIIRQKRSEGVTIILTTHNMYAADELCDEVAFLHDGRMIARDTPRNLKLQYGERAVRVEYEENDTVQEQLLFPDREEDRLRLAELVQNARIQTMHSQEATLEQIFMQMTGRGLQ